MPARVLIADDQFDVLIALELLLKGDGMLTVSASSPREVVAAVRSDSFDAVLMDLNYTRDTTSGQEGLELVTEIHRLDPDLPVIVMTAWGSIELAVEAMRRGARDFVLKPWDNRSLLETLRVKIEEGGRERKKHKRSEEDLEIARQVQMNLFPRGSHRFANLEYAGRCVQAGAVGGDYYDFPDVGPDRFATVIADVSGKGIPAALLMANLQATLRSQCQNVGRPLTAILRSVHALFLESTDPHHFATLFFGCYDPPSRRLSYVNCGHNPPLLLRPGGAYEKLEPTGTVLGLLPAWTCGEADVQLCSGDVMLMYSDGITEAGRENGEEFGEDRLLRSLERARALPIQQLVEAVLTDVRTWLGGRDQEDDLTLVAVRGVS
ncbi:MAG: SpoIIE family protein phosphatase [Bryobacteraceae bacterium]|nr:SpoIIE family protein phosphatase [Bryobacteraceae bacterium]